MRKIAEERKEEFLYLYKKGCNDYEIARIMKVSDSTIFRWRKSFNLPAYHTNILSRNQELVPTQEQLEILTGTLLGDSSLQYYPQYRWRSPKFKCDHGEPQKEYAELLLEKLASLKARLKSYKRKDYRTNKVYITHTITTASNPYFFKMYNELYINGNKQITSEFLKNFTIKSLAYLYMDDGYFDQNTAFICTDCFSSESIETLIFFLKENFNLSFSKVYHGKYYRIRLSQYDFPRFKELLSPYVIDTLKYKLNTVT